MDKISIEVTPKQLEHLMHLEESFVDELQIRGVCESDDKNLLKLLLNKYNECLKGSMKDE